jgi:hypothetical protein
VSRYTVEERGFDTPCWVWHNATRSGYGQHRAYYKRHVGDIPPGMQLDHLCRVRACVNPEHLEPVTLAINCQRNSNAKLDMAMAEKIRQRYRAGGVRQRELAAEYGVSPDTISRVVNDRGWHPEGDLAHYRSQSANPARTKPPVQVDEGAGDVS